MQIRQTDSYIYMQVYGDARQEVKSNLERPSFHNTPSPIIPTYLPFVQSKYLQHSRIQLVMYVLQN